MVTELIVLVFMLMVGAAEWWHQRRITRVAHLAFGPQGQPRKWTKAAPWLRTLACGAALWGCLTLFNLGPVVVQSKQIPEGGYRHLLLALDVSPSMKLKDGGPEKSQTRTHRAGEVLMSVLERIATDQVRISVVAFYTTAKPVVVDTYDLEVVRNILNDLPLELAFDVGKTKLFEGIRMAVDMARPWQPDSTVLILASDGDTVPDSGLVTLPASINQVLVVGVGDADRGLFIDGHQSRQDVGTLRQLANRLNGRYFNANAKHLPSDALLPLAEIMPLRDVQEKGRRELALALLATGAGTLALLPFALAMAGTAWQGYQRGFSLQNKKVPSASRSAAR